MKKVFLVVVSVLAITLSACGQAQDVEAVPTVVLEAGEASRQMKIKTPAAIRWLHRVSWFHCRTRIYLLPTSVV